ASMAVTRGARRAASILATALVALAATAAAASADVTIGPASVAGNDSQIASPSVTINTYDQAPASGTVTGWSVNLTCPPDPNPCRPARLVPPKQPATGVFPTDPTSDGKAAPASGVQTYTTPQRITAGGSIAVETNGPQMRVVQDGPPQSVEVQFSAIDDG